MTLREKLRTDQKFRLARKAARPITPQERKNKIDAILRGFQNYRRESWVFRVLELVGLR